MPYNAPANNAVALQITSGGYVPPSGSAVNLTLQDTSGGISGVSSAFLQFSGSAIGRTVVAGQGSVALSFYPTSQGKLGSVGEAQAFLSLQAAASGVRYNPPIDIFATVDANIAFTAEVVGLRYRPDNVALSFSGDPITTPNASSISLDFGTAEVVTPTGSVSAFATFDALALGVVGRSGQIDATLPFTAEVASYAIPIGEVHSSLVFSGSGSGVAVVVGSAQGSLGLSASADAKHSIKGTAASSISLIPASSGKTGVSGTISPSLSLYAQALGSFSQATVTGNAITELELIASAQGRVGVSGTAGGSLHLESPARGLHGEAGTANVSFGFVGDLWGYVGRAGATSAELGLYASAFGIGRPDAVSGYSHTSVAFTAAVDGVSSRRGTVAATFGFEPYADASLVVTSTANANILLQSIAIGKVGVTGYVGADLLLSTSVGGNVAPYWAIDLDRSEAIYAGPDILYVQTEDDVVFYRLENEDVFEYTTPNILYVRTQREDWYVEHQA